MRFLSFLLAFILYRQSSWSTRALGLKGCILYRTIGVNDLPLNDIAVKSLTDDTICMRAKFALAIKLDGGFDPLNLESNNGPQTGLLGFLPMDRIVKVEQNCPGPGAEFETIEDGIKIFYLRVEFECGHLDFHFRQDLARYYLAKINGTINIDPMRSENLEVDRKLFLTSDLRHHFSHKRLFEVKAKSGNPDYIFTIQFYKSEFEAFRKTSYHDFILPPDENSSLQI